MPLFFFDLDECGSVTEDPEGRHAIDVDAARQLAIQDARALMCSELYEGKLCLSCFIDIRVEGGEVVQRVVFRDVVELTEDQNG